MCAEDKYSLLELRKLATAFGLVSKSDGLFSQMMDQLNRDKTLFEAEKVHNRISAESESQEIDEQLKRLLDLSVSGVISDEEYKEKKARLVNKKFELQAKGSRDGEWLERYRNLITLAHQASYIAAEENFEAQRDFLRSCGSNISLNNGSLAISYRYPWRHIVETHGNKKWGPSRMSRGETSLYLQG